VGGRKFISSTKTEAGRRTVPLSPMLGAMLAAHIAEFGPRDAEGRVNPAGFVFSHAQGGLIRQNNWRSRVFQPACERLGITRPSADGTRRFPRVHDLRHAAASILLTEGFAAHEVQAILGHSSSQTTLRIYAHGISESVKAKAVALYGSLEEAVSRARGENVIPIQSHSVAG
jgi:integrase